MAYTRTSKLSFFPQTSIVRTNVAPAKTTIEEKAFQEIISRLHELYSQKSKPLEQDIKRSQQLEADIKKANNIPQLIYILNKSNIAPNINVINQIIIKLTQFKQPKIITSFQELLECIEDSEATNALVEFSSQGQAKDHKESKSNSIDESKIEIIMDRMLERMKNDQSAMLYYALYLMHLGFLEKDPKKQSEKLLKGFVLLSDISTYTDKENITNFNFYIISILSLAAHGVIDIDEKSTERSFFDLNQTKMLLQNPGIHKYLLERYNPWKVLSQLKNDLNITEDSPLVIQREGLSTITINLLRKELKDDKNGVIDINIAHAMAIKDDSSNNLIGIASSIQRAAQKGNHLAKLLYGTFQLQEGDTINGNHNLDDIISDDKASTIVKADAFFMKGMYIDDDVVKQRYWIEAAKLGSPIAIAELEILYYEALNSENAAKIHTLTKNESWKQYAENQRLILLKNNHQYPDIKSFYGLQLLTKTETTDEGVFLLQEAAKENCPEAICTLGVNQFLNSIYLDEKSKQETMLAAIHNLEIAATMGNFRAHKFLKCIDSFNDENTANKLMAQIFFDEKKAAAILKKMITHYKTLPKNMHNLTVLQHIKSKAIDAMHRANKECLQARRNLFTTRPSVSKMMRQSNISSHQYLKNMVQKLTPAELVDSIIASQESKHNAIRQPSLIVDPRPAIQLNPIYDVETTSALAALRADPNLDPKLIDYMGRCYMDAPEKSGLRPQQRDLQKTNRYFAKECFNKAIEKGYLQSYEHLIYCLLLELKDTPINEKVLRNRLQHELYRTITKASNLGVASAQVQEGLRYAYMATSDRSRTYTDRKKYYEKASAQFKSIAATSKNADANYYQGILLWTYELKDNNTAAHENLRKFSQLYALSRWPHNKLTQFQVKTVNNSSAKDFTAFAPLEAAASDGHPNAAFELNVMKLRVAEANQDQKAEDLAIEKLTKLATQNGGFTLAEAFLAEYYLKNKRDLVTAKIWIQKLINKNHPYGHLGMGLCTLDEKEIDDKKAISHFKAAAKLNNLKAMEYLRLYANHPDKALQAMAQTELKEIQSETKREDNAAIVFPIPMKHQLPYEIIPPLASINDKSLLDLMLEVQLKKPFDRHAPEEKLAEDIKPLRVKRAPKIPKRKPNPKLNRDEKDSKTETPERTPAQIKEQEENDRLEKEEEIKTHAEQKLQLQRFNDLSVTVTTPTTEPMVDSGGFYAGATEKMQKQREHRAFIKEKVSEANRLRQEDRRCIEAIDLLEDLLHKGFVNHNLLLELTHGYISMGKYNSALACLQKSKSTSKNDITNANIIRAQIYIAMQRYNDAKNILLPLLNDDSISSGQRHLALLHCGVLFTKTENTEVATAVFSELNTWLDTPAQRRLRASTKDDYLYSLAKSAVATRFYIRCKVRYAQFCEALGSTVQARTIYESLYKSYPGNPYVEQRYFSQFDFSNDKDKLEMFGPNYESPADDKSINLERTDEMRYTFALYALTSRDKAKHVFKGEGKALTYNQYARLELERLAKQEHFSATRALVRVYLNLYKPNKALNMVEKLKAMRFDILIHLLEIECYFALVLNTDNPDERVSYKKIADSLYEKLMTTEDACITKETLAEIDDIYSRYGFIRPEIGATSNPDEMQNEALDILGKKILQLCEENQPQEVKNSLFEYLKISLETLFQKNNAYYKNHIASQQADEKLLPFEIDLKSEVSASNPDHKHYIDAQQFQMQNDDAKAFASYQEAARLNYAPALSALGVIYRRGNSHVNPDIKLAENYFQKAIDRGSISAKYNFGIMLIERNEITKGHQLLMEAAKGKHPKALWYLATLFKRIFDEQQNEAARHEAIKLLKQLNNLGYVKSQQMLAALLPTAQPTKGFLKSLREDEKHSAALSDIRGLEKLEKLQKQDAEKKYSQQKAVVPVPSPQILQTLNPSPADIKASVASAQNSATKEQPPLSFGWEKVDPRQINYDAVSVYQTDAKIPNIVKSYLDRLTDNGFQALIVGSWVYDKIVKKYELKIDSNPRDIDIVTNASIKDMQRLFPELYNNSSHSENMVRKLFRTNTSKDQKHSSEEKIDIFCEAPLKKDSYGVNEDAEDRDLYHAAYYMDKNGRLITPFKGEEFIQSITNKKNPPAKLILKKAGETLSDKFRDPKRIVRLLEAAARGHHIPEDHCEALFKHGPVFTKNVIAPNLLEILYSDLFLKGHAEKILLALFKYELYDAFFTLDAKDVIDTKDEYQLKIDYLLSQARKIDAKSTAEASNPLAVLLSRSRLIEIYATLIAPVVAKNMKPLDAKDSVNNLQIKIANDAYLDAVIEKFNFPYHLINVWQDNITKQSILRRHIYMQLEHPKLVALKECATPKPLPIPSLPTPALALAKAVAVAASPANSQPTGVATNGMFAAAASATPAAPIPKLDYATDLAAGLIPKPAS